MTFPVDPNTFNPFRRENWPLIAEAINQGVFIDTYAGPLTELLGRQPPVPPGGGGGSPDPYADYVVSSAVGLSVTRWRYNIKLAKPDTIVLGKYVPIDPDPQNVGATAYNTWEGHNTAPPQQGAVNAGMGAFVGAFPQSSTTVSMLPIMNGVHVRAKPITLENGNPLLVFHAPNDRTVNCG